MISTPTITNKVVAYTSNSDPLKVKEETIPLIKGEDDNYTVESSKILVKVHSVALNPVDLLMRNTMFGVLKYFKGENRIGLDYSGEVVAIGKGAEKKYGLVVGDKVFGFCSALKPKSLAEYIVFDKSSDNMFDITKVPDNISMTEAAAVGLVSCTAIQLIEISNLPPNSRVLVNGGTTAVGRYLLSLLKVNENVKDIVAICSGKNASLALELGATETIDYTSVDTYNAVLESAKNGMFDVLYNLATSEKLFNHLSDFMKGGQYLDCTGTKGSDLMAETLLSRMGFSAIKAFFMSMLGLSDISYQYCLVQCDGSIEKIADLLKNNTVKVFIDSVYSFDDYPKAFEKLVSQKLQGKVVIQVE